MKKNKILLILLAFIIIILLSSKVEANSGTYSIDEVNMDVVLQKDGSLKINEKLTYKFNGSFNGIYITIPYGINDNKYDKKELRDLIEAHVEATGSEIGKKVLADFDSYLPHFKKLIPDEYKRMITLSAKLEEKGLTSQQAQMEAFYESIGVKH